MAVGDVLSPERGSGTRYNDGKAQVEYIPAGVLAAFYTDIAIIYGSAGSKALRLLNALAAFEAGTDSAVFLALEYLGPDRWKLAAAQFDFGAKKYAPWNWAKGMAWSIPLACAKRHLIAILEGETDDPESGVSHFGAVGCNLVMLVHFLEHYPEGDDRPPENVFARNTRG